MLTLNPKPIHNQTKAKSMILLHVTEKHIKNKKCSKIICPYLLYVTQDLLTTRRRYQTNLPQQAIRDARQNEVDINAFTICPSKLYVTLETTRST